MKTLYGFCAIILGIIVILFTYNIKISKGDNSGYNIKLRGYAFGLLCIFGGIMYILK